MDTLIQGQITKISQVAPDVTWFLRDAGLSDYYIIKLYDEMRGRALDLVREDPYSLLDIFPRLGFRKADEIAGRTGVGRSDPRRVKAALRYRMSYSLSEGSSYVRRQDLIQDVSDMLDVPRAQAEEALSEMVLEGTMYATSVAGEEAVYFYNLFRAESRTASRLVSLSAQDAQELKNVVDDPESYLRRFEDEKGIDLSGTQRQAVLSAVASGVTVITGGPGTGKTTILNAIIYILEQSGQKVAVSAPTGRAAKRITETGGHFAQTVHRLLEYYYDELTGNMFFAKNADSPLKYDCVIVDEASMLDIFLMSALLDAIKDGTRLIIVGDKDQLPSVGAGKVLEDLIDSGCFNTVILKDIYRQEAESGIVMNAHRINVGDYPLIDDAAGNFRFMSIEKQKDIQDAIVRYALDHKDGEVQVLTPSRKGLLGTADLNVRLQDELNPKDPEKEEMTFGKRIFREGDKVMQIKNDYGLAYKRESTDHALEDGRGIFNGEIGTIIGVDPAERSLAVVFDDDSTGIGCGRRYVKYEYTELDELELAYAITIHKGQGSEYETVVIPVSWFPPLLSTRSLIYTGITRGAKNVVLIGEQKYLNQMVDNDRRAARLSGLTDRIIQAYDLKMPRGL
ncbi:MAG: AAA family ATPase [Clostridia bacterium]|nr:AAA family ATPase [Clostridia bacterium]